MNELEKIAEYFIVFNDNDTEKEFLQKCLKQHENVIESNNNDIIKIFHLSIIFTEVQNRINNLENNKMNDLNCVDSSILDKIRNSEKIGNKLEHDLAFTDNTYIEIASEIAFNSVHDYKIRNSHDDSELCKIHFQEGAVKETGVNGIFMEDIISICINRLENFQNSDFRCRENAVAITKLEETLMWLRKRTLNRQKRGVQGTYQK